MNKIISFCLWGSNLKYTVGAIRNAELANDLYPGWKSRFYTSKTVPDSILYMLEEIPNTEILYYDFIGDWKSMFWRFEAGYDPNVSVAIFRDTDSRLNIREKAAVDEWLKSDKTLHIMRDHPYHKFPILGGMWGYKNNGKYNIKEMLEQFYNLKATNNYGTDYEFLGNVLKPALKDDILVHDPFFEKKDFPTKREDLQFVGQVFDENEITVQEHIDVLKKYI